MPEREIAAFEDHFFDCRTHRPKPGQVLAKFTAAARLGDGALKRDLIDLLKKPGRAEAALRVFVVLGNSSRRDAMRVLREMASDLAAGAGDDEVAARPYKFTLEQFYWADRDSVPRDDPHWDLIPIAGNFPPLPGPPERLQ